MLHNNPVSGVPITFTAPGSGASGTFSNGTATITLATASNGLAAASFTANGVTGSYTVTASASGLTAANFSLTNNPLPPAKITATAGNSQSATINTAFGGAASHGSGCE